MLKWKTRFASHAASPWDDGAAIGAELFGPERFEQHAHSLAASQRLAKARIDVYSVVRRLDDNAQTLLKVYRDICAAVAAGKTLTPAAEWLADNYHLVEEQIRQTRADLPEGFYRQLPKLAGGPLAGHPRIFGVIWAYVAHTDSRFDPATLIDFINAYQTVEPLSIGELWAAAICLRLILIENLGRISVRMNAARLEREAADAAADRILGVAGDTRPWTGADAPVAIPYAVQLLQRLRDLEDSRAAEVLEWLRKAVAAKDHTLESVVSDEHHRQAAANVTVRNIVNSMRLVADINWESWFDSVSIADKTFRRIALYEEMDFQSRNAYRTAVEDLARGSGVPELDVVGRVLERVSEAGGATEPGHWLLGAGRQAFERDLGFKPAPLDRIRGVAAAAGLGGYLGATLAVAAAVLAAAAAGLWGAADGWAIAFLLLIAAIPASEPAFAIVQQIVTRLLRTRTLPGLALRGGVPDRFRTLIAIPALLTSPENIEELIGRLEVHFLSSGLGELHFALVTDWTDAEVALRPGDQELLDRAVQGIAALNRRHETGRFLLLHRGRRWNEAQGAWMGYERKRGKLGELNRLLRGAEDTTFETIAGDLPKDVRFVITLDADTRLPRDAARRMIGKMAHPLNQPHADAAARRVAAGHGILQPRVTASLPTGHYGSAFQQLFSTARGIDPYVFAASDLYQDYFGEGSFTGKGIYDIDAFEAALSSRFPDNTVLSHDLLEGVYARAGLVSDIEVVEEYPEQYEVSAARQHRWARGDWQLLPWIFGRHGAVPALGRWKMLDNLRRSLVPVTAIAALFAGWALLSAGAAALWSAMVLAAILLPILLPAAIDGFRVAPHATVKLHLMALGQSLGHALALAAATVVLLAHQSALMADAIVRTLYRLAISRRNLLEWTTAAQAAANAAPGLARSYLSMPASPALGALALALGAYRGLETWWWLSIPAIAWMGAPAVAHWISRSAALEDELAAAEADRRALRATARRTWRFFERFVASGDNMLPPDNFQEHPAPVVAHRTSPTNIGLYLLSTAAAREFGWLGLVEAAAKLEAVFQSIGRLETFRGHLYNWYDTQSLAPLEPKYVSSVDSGNLAGHLVALANSCEAWIAEPGIGEAAADGIEDALDILVDEVKSLPQGLKSLGPLRKTVLRQADALRAALAKARQDPDLLAIRLVEVAVQANTLVTATARLAQEAPEAARDALGFWPMVVRDTVESHFRDASMDAGQANVIRQRLRRLADGARRLAYGMEFGFLFDPQRYLLAIGYRVREAMRDENCYDMLASEARLASFFAIAKGDLQTRHWFRLGRAVTALQGGAALVSWSGSMFEYLMPSLVMRAPSGGLLDQTTRLVVARQIAYANAFGVPWGVSESAFSARDTGFTYQYSNFGVPGLGLKRGLADNLVIAPYATGLATMVAPKLAARNYETLRRAGAQGGYGFYEALDYTPSRLSPTENVAVVRAYFAHHQGMSIVAILNAVRGGILRERFHAEPSIRAAELLLQERAPRDVLAAVPAEAARAPQAAELSPVLPRQPQAFGGAAPATHLLSNGQYSVMLTAAGGGYSQWNGLAITRWRDDPLEGEWGQFLYLREVKPQQWWSAGHLPSCAEGESYEAAFSEHKGEIVRSGGAWTTTLECIVSSESNAEARRLTIANTSLTARDIEITSYCELVLAPLAADISHPAFSKLFVETKFVPGIDALIATRRNRSAGDPKICVAQIMLVEGAAAGPLEYETARERFLGRCRDTRSPAAMDSGMRLWKTTGTVLDPVFALRRRLTIARGRQARVTVWTMAAASESELLDLIDQHSQAAAFERALMLAWTQAQIQLRHLSITGEEAHLFQELAGYVVHSNPALRPPAGVLAKDIGSQTHLWPQGISGDLPVVLLRIDTVEDIDAVRQILRAFEYWKSKRLAVDVVVLNDRMASYVQDLQQALDALVRKMRTPPEPGARAGDIFVLRADLAAPETLRTLAATARIVLYARRGGIAAQLARLRTPPLAPARRARTALALVPQPAAPAKPEGLRFYNGSGGFSANGTEYVIHPTPGKPTPAPWINVIANPGFGFHCSSDGLHYTWTGNSKEMQLTGWSNDPVSNRPGEAIYVTDAKSGRVTSPTVLPLRDSSGTYATAHGFGYSRFERQVDGLRMELVQFVPTGDPIKISRLRLVNLGREELTLSVTAYAEWVLGPSRSATHHNIVTAIDAATGALTAENRWTPLFGNQVAFLDLQGRQTSWTGDRLEFLGRYGSLGDPQALNSGRALSNRTGAGMDPCGVLQTSLTIAPGASQDCVILLGAAADLAAAQALAIKYRAADVDSALAGVKAHWSGILGAVAVKTPDPAFDAMMNGWLIYQTLACRIWARSGFYQASGAYGFRDQLQDTMALLLARPDLAREQILRAAARQFPEGDVQHWWLPATGTGIRTHFSDDVVWLVHCVARYAAVTGDLAVLDEEVAFLDGPKLQAGEHDAFFQPTDAGERAPLYEHCARALERALRTGRHGLPLMGGGDWNDGMNRVGEQGQGESVWLGWFLVATLEAFIPIARRRGDARAAQWQTQSAALVAALEKDGWDGAWYRRAFYDDGTPLGSAANSECAIDSIVQSWAAISGKARPERVASAMAQVDARLVRRTDKLSMLFTPPFDKTEKDPGYIKAYPPGIRENGGQYTHGAIWSVFALAELGEEAKAYELFGMLNPVNHGATPQDVANYRVEPYAAAADIYSVAPHAGRGGWTWYTGAAGWLYRAGLEAILGIRKEGDTLSVKPCMPPEWNEFDVTIQLGETRRDIHVRRGAKTMSDHPAVEKISNGEFRIDLNGGDGPRRIVLTFADAAAAAVPAQKLLAS